MRVGTLYSTVTVAVIHCSWTWRWRRGTWRASTATSAPGATSASRRPFSRSSRPTCWWRPLSRCRFCSCDSKCLHLGMAQGQLLAKFYGLQ